MGKRKRQGYKRNHHFVPRFYLKGFTEPESPSMLWVYERDRDYIPGRGRLTANPYHYSISQAGMEEDYYAYQRDDGAIDYETYENALEKKEKPADRLIDKIRNFQPLNGEEKFVLSQYITMMCKRVPHRAKEAHKIWPEVLEENAQILAASFDEARSALQAAGDDKAVRWLDKQRIDVDAKLNAWRRGMPDDIRLETMLMGMPMTQKGIASMRWQYFHAPNEEFFITNDNPVFRFESLGFRHPQSEFTFPISSSVAIVGSWYQHAPEAFVPATSEAVHEINRRTCRFASCHVYARVAHRQIYDMVQDANSKLSVLYGYVIPSIGEPVLPGWVLDV